MYCITTKSKIIWKVICKKKVNYAPKCNQLFLGDYKRMCSGTLNSLLCGWNYLTWQCSVESHNYFTEKNLTGESPGPRIVWWCRQHNMRKHPPPPLPLCIFQHGDQDVGLIELGFQWGFYFKKRGAILLF